ncbi:MAG: cell division protein [Verrucomicrobiales bacterium]|nr:cell division protein [Verrucomicrobiales bacterium]
MSEEGVNYPEEINSLREAVRMSPDNAPLRQHLADTYLKYGHGEEAEKEYRTALSKDPDNPNLKFGLARTFFQLNKNSHALVVLEDLAEQSRAPGRAFVLYAKLLAGAGDVEQAVIQYRRGVERDPDAEDREFADRLGIDTEEEESEVIDGMLRNSWEGDDEGAPVEDIEKPKIKFEDVGGMDKVKEEIQMKIIHPLHHQDLYAAYGKTIGGGILMYGPPGCGKTYLARATAGEINASFISVGINDVLDMWIGNSERNLHALFEQARQNTPCVLFFDEVDALGASRSDMKQNAGRMLINQFLSEFDGVKDSNEGVLILAATNAPWHLDSAFRRPGRFDRILFVPPPDNGARASIMQLHCQGKPVEDIDYTHLAKKTDGFSGADLKAVLDIAIEAKLREAMKIGVPQPMTTKDLVKAAKQQKATTKEWFSTARNYALYSNQGGIYDDILDYMKLR